MAKQMIRLKDISAKSGHSISTVSKALLGKTDIGEETRARIISIARAMGYKPNSMARYLRLGQTNLIGIIIPDNRNPYYSLILKEIENIARQHGYITIIMNADEEEKLERTVLNTLLSLSVDGIIAVPAYLDNYADVTVPTIFISRFPYRAVGRTELVNIEYEVNSEYSYVVNDDYYGQKLAAAHLMDTHGDNVYIMLGVDKGNCSSVIKDSIRLDGFYDALMERMLPFDPKKVLWNSETIQSTYDSTLTLCRHATPPFGICLYNDRVALGAIRAIHDSGLRIPQDVSVIGFDDLEFSAYCTPRLSTIRSAKFSMGSHATLQLTRILAHPTDDSQIVHTTLQPDLIVRQSSV